MKRTLPLIVFLLLLMRFNGLFAQAPVISYAVGPQTYQVGTAITPLAPTNTGGAPNGGGIVSTVAGDGNAGNVNGTGSGAEFNFPGGVAVDASNNVFVADYGNNLIRKITPTGVVTTFAGSGAAGSADGTGTAASFNGPGSMTIDASGNLYVADFNGIRKISPAAVVTTLTTSFAGSAIAIDASGNLFIGTGATIYKMPPSGVAAAFSEIPSPVYLDYSPSISGIAVDGLGNVYVSDAIDQTVDKITPTGALTVLAGSCGPGSFRAYCAPGLFNDPRGLAVDALGNLYVADGGNNNIKVIDQAGNVNIFAGAFDGTAGFADGPGGAFNLPSALAVGPSNNLYVGDSGNNAIRKVTIGGYTISPILPTGLAFDGGTGTISGTPAVPSPATNYTVSAYNDAGTGTTTLNITINNILPVISYPQAPIAVTTGTAFSISPTNTAGPADSYSSGTPLPAGINLDGTTGIISGTPTTVSPPANYNIIAHNAAGNDTLAVNIAVTAPPPTPKISYAGPKTYTIGVPITPLSPSSTGGAIPPNTMVSTFAGNGTFGSVNAANLSSSFAHPVGLVFNGVGNLFVLDNSTGAVRKISPTGMVSTFVTGFNGPAGIAVDAALNLYVSDSGNNLVKEISPTGVITTFSDGISNPPCLTCVTGFATPVGLAVNGTGLIVADIGNSQVDVVSSQNGRVDSFGSFTTQGFNTFLSPWGIATSPGGNIYVSDQGLNTIFNVTTPLAGAADFSTGSANGTGSAASFNGPVGIATDAQGNLYVADQGNNLIRKVTPAGVVTTFAGSGLQGSANGVDSLASFNQPTGITVDPFGNVYVAESGNNLIRKIVPGGYSITPALPPGLVFDRTTGIISGTPTALSPAVIYTITAYNGGGQGTATVSIKVVSASTDATLTNLQISSGSLSPTFAATTTSYTAAVANAVSSITVTPTTSDTTARVTVNGSITPSGFPSASIPLLVGSNTITVLVTAGDGVTTDNYTITVTRAPSSNANLANLQLSTGTLSPSFASNTTSYSVSFGNATSSIIVTPTTSDSTARVTVNGVATASGSPSASIPLIVGSNTITTVVTAQDGTTTKTYTITVTRSATAGSDNAYLSGLQISKGTLQPAFTTKTLNYTARVGRTTSSLTVTPTAFSSFAVIRVNGIIVTSGTASSPISLSDGINNISIVITAQNGVTTRSYSLVVTKEGGSLDSFYSVTDSTKSELLTIDGPNVRQGLSPNGDGINDVLMIDNIGAYPDNKLLVVNRSGALIFEAEGYDNVTKVFDGHSNQTGFMQEPGTYFYSLAYKANGQLKYKTGFFVLKY